MRPLADEDVRLVLESPLVVRGRPLEVREQQRDVLEAWV
jgi:hypothetical protein